MFIGILITILMLLDFSKVSSDIKWYCFTLVAVFLFFIVAFRTCGFDFANYLEYFRSLNSIYWFDNAEVLLVEKGYAFLNYFFNSYREVLVVIAAVTIILQFSFIYK